MYSSSSGSSDGHGSSSVVTRAQASAGQPDAPWGGPQQSAGSQLDADGPCAAGDCEQQTQRNSGARTEFVQTAAAAAAAASGSSVAATAAVSPQQFTNSWGWLRNSGVNPVFYEPTYNPCTPCGPACWTDSPGATSVRQCGEWHAAAARLQLFCWQVASRKMESAEGVPCCGANNAHTAAAAAADGWCVCCCPPCSLCCSSQQPGCLPTSEWQQAC